LLFFSVNLLPFTPSFSLFIFRSFMLLLPNSYCRLLMQWRCLLISVFERNISHIRWFLKFAV
jgi:hypothetical protein